MTPTTLANAAACYCVNDDIFKKVVVYLLDQINSGGGGGSVQDMQVAWTPTNLKFGELIAFNNFGGVPLTGITKLTFQQTSIGSVDLENAPDLVEIDFPNLLTVISPVYLELGPGCPNLATITFPKLTDCSGGFDIDGTAITSLALTSLVTTPSVANSFSIINNASLVNLSLPVWVPHNNTNPFAFSGNALNAASVNGVLARCVANVSYTSGTVNLQGGTNAAPSGQGVADKATLIGRGVTVNTN